ncbi:MAG: GntR family transcriptional regulator [Synergistales bacterium]|nr:GntR family transcriptional regulator [Synergistales bacterium]
MSDYPSPSEHAYREIMKKIINEELMAGQRLPTIPLAEAIGVSRTPVIEALRRLAGQGIVVFSRGSGARLVAPSRKEIEEAYSVRAHLERMSSSLAAQHADPVQLCRMEEAIKVEEGAGRAKDALGTIEANMEFHRIVGEASGNSFLAWYVQNVVSTTFVYQVLFESISGEGFDTSPQEHWEILHALRSGSSAVADIMERHVLLAINVLSRIPLDEGNDLSYGGDTQ